MTLLLLTWRHALGGANRSTIPLRAATLRWLLACLLLGVAYGLAARVGLAYSSLAPNVTLIWAPTGISLFAVLRWGPGLWPGIVIGDLLQTGAGGTMIKRTTTNRIVAIALAAVDNSAGGSAVRLKVEIV